MYRWLIALPRRLMLLPYEARILLVLALFIICGLLLCIDFPVRFHIIIFAIPTGLAAWIFRSRYAFITLLSTLSVLTIMMVMNAGFLWPAAQIAAFITDILILSCINLIIIYLSTSVERFQNLQVQEQKTKHQLITEYEQRIESLQTTHDVILAYEQMQKINQLKDDFLANITHELRTPLTQVYGYLELLNEHGTLVDEETRRFSWSPPLRDAMS